MRPRAYWLDIGTPQRYLRGTIDILEGKVRGRVVATHSWEGCGRSPCDVEVGPLAVLGPSRRSVGRVGAGSTALRRAGGRRGRASDCELRDCIVAPGADRPGCVVSAAPSWARV